MSTERNEKSNSLAKRECTHSHAGNNWFLKAHRAIAHSIFCTSSRGKRCTETGRRDDVQRSMLAVRLAGKSSAASRRCRRRQHYLTLYPLESESRAKSEADLYIRFNICLSRSHTWWAFARLPGKKWPREDTDQWLGQGPETTIKSNPFSLSQMVHIGTAAATRDVNAHTEAALDFIFNYAPDKAQIYLNHTLARMQLSVCVCIVKRAHRTKKSSRRQRVYNYI